MPNPVINPAVWAAGATFTVTGSSFVAVDVRVDDIANAPASMTVTAPAGATVHAFRNPNTWAGAGAQLLSGGAWVAAPVVLSGNWTVTVAPGGAATDPATITVENSDGVAPSGTLRLVLAGLAGGAATIEPGGGTLSIDRVLADPSFLNVQVTSGLPVKELDAVTLGATVQPTQATNPAPATPLPAPPAILSGWAEEPGNPLAVKDFASVGTAASFTAPAAYADTALSFRLTGTYDLDASGTATLGEPSGSHVLPVTVTTVRHGMVLVIDRSGSMGAGFGAGLSRWDAAVQAAHAWLDLFRALRPGDQHKAGIVTFEHDPCSWTPSPAADVTLRNPATGAAAAAMSTLVDLGNVPVLNLGAVDSCTPIGDALVKAFQAITAAMPAGSKASVLLLTDGYENSGRVTIAAAKGSAATTFAQERVTPALSFANGLVGERLYTIAVGDSVDEDRLNDLGAGFYQLTSEAKQVLPAFAEMLGEVLDAEPAMPIAFADPNFPNSLYFPVPTGEQKVAFLVPWDSATHELRVGWRTQGSAGDFTLVDPNGAGVLSFRRQTHGLIVVDIATVTGAGTATEWRLQHMNGNVAVALPADGALVMTDLVTRATVSFDKRQYFIGDAIRLACRINSGGVPVTRAKVYVDVARPGEGLGTFLATNADLYKPDRQEPRGTTGAAGGTLDPQKGKGLMFGTLLAILKLDGLPKVAEPDFELLDDGAHEDGKAEDGVFANLYKDTLKEGTYTFRFRIEGELPDGSRFSRLFVRSTWAGVRPDPFETEFVWKLIEDRTQDLAVAVLTLTPKSATREFLGPFREADIVLKVMHGQFDGRLVDNLNGSYSQRVLYRPYEFPIVSVSIYGQDMPPTGPGLVGPSLGGPSLGGTPPGTTGKGCLALWLAAIRCTCAGCVAALCRLFGKSSKT